MLLAQSRERFVDSLMGFLWRQWSQLGAAGHIEFRDRWLIDPEALLILSLQVARHDSRLYDEVLDWTVRNSGWMSVQRLRNLLRSMDLDLASRVSGAVASIVTDSGRDLRWRSLIGEDRSGSPERIPLFVGRDGVELPVLAQPDPVFERCGVLRPIVHLRGLSLPIPMEPRTNLTFRLRALFGLGPRAEVIAYLLTHTEAHPGEIARSVHYGPRAAGEALSGLALSGVVTVRESGREKPYSLHSARWRQFLDVPTAPDWIEWPGVFRALAAIESFLCDPLVTDVSDYMTRSRMVSVTEEVHRGFAGSGLAYKFYSPTRIFDHPQDFVVLVLQGLMHFLNRKAVGSKPNSPRSV